ncbi:MAG: DUF799 family lipoprotein [Desulfobacteraceae bacterium]
MMMRICKKSTIRTAVLLALIMTLAGCATSVPDRYHDANMDFSILKSVAVMPFLNLSGQQLAGERVRNTFMSSLLATGVLYVIPAGEVARGIDRAGLTNPTAPSSEDVAKLAAIVKADAVITGVVKEYGNVRSGNTIANIISVDMQMIEKESRKVVWSASTTQGGIGMWDRLMGGGGQPMNDVTRAAVDDIINKLIR